jgi:ribose transport system permease protein
MAKLVAATMPKKSRVIKFKFSWRTMGLQAVLLVVITAFALGNDRFYSLTNLQNVATQISVLALLSLAEMIPVLSGGIDLAIGTTVGLVSVIMAQVCLTYGIPAGIAAGLLVGLAVGLFNGLLITRLSMPPLIVTLGTLSIAEGAALLYSNGIPITGLPIDFNFLGAGTLGPVPVPFALVVVVYLIMHFLLTRTRFGRYTYAIGGNEQATRLSGIPVDNYKILVYVVCGVLVAVGGIVLTSRVMSGQAVMGQVYLMQAVAAVFIGGARYGGGQGTVLGTAIGVLLMGILANGLNLLDVSSYIQEVVIGFVIILAVANDYYQKWRSQK